MSTHNLCFHGEIRKLITLKLPLSGSIWISLHYLPLSPYLHDLFLVHHYYFKYAFTCRISVARTDICTFEDN